MAKAALESTVGYGSSVAGANGSELRRLRQLVANQGPPPRPRSRFASSSPLGSAWVLLWRHLLSLSARCSLRGNKVGPFGSPLARASPMLSSKPEAGGAVQGRGSLAHVRPRWPLWGVK
eukprot:7426207-Pyramimonas_sp.AAC.1